MPGRGPAGTKCEAGMNKRLEIFQVDAFTDIRYGGNPCAVVPEAGGLSDAAMQDIAREMNLSETAFVLPSEQADVRARYFTPSNEIPMAGHPTLATIQTLLMTGRLAARDSMTVRLELQAGVVDVDVRQEAGGLQRITMSQCPPEFLDIYDQEAILPAFGLDPSDALGEYPAMTVSTGTPQLMVPLRSLGALKRARVDGARFESLLPATDFFSMHLFVLQGIDQHGATFARHFTPPPDTFEDPFTGSATGGMAAYLWRHGLLKEPAFVAQQGHWMHRPGQAFVEVVGPPSGIETVKVGGYAVEVMRGEIIVPD